MCLIGSLTCIGLNENTGSNQSIEVSCADPYTTVIVLGAFASAMCVITGATAYGFLMSYRNAEAE
jgi:hypothetical protein